MAGDTRRSNRRRTQTVRAQEADGASTERKKSKKGKGKETLHVWEEEYQRSWDVVQEDESGSLQTSVDQWLAGNRRRRILRDATAVQRGIIRHLVLVIDLSLSMMDRDLRPTRLELSIQYAKEFINEFFDQNPISQLAIVGTRDGLAERLSPLSGNPIDHEKGLANKRKLDPSGEPSLQNALEMAKGLLSHLPSHGSREIVVIFGSLTTCDPGNIHTTIESLEKLRIRVSIIGLAAELRICREISVRTHGSFGVVLNEQHFRDLLMESVQPPPLPSSTITTTTRSSLLSALNAPPTPAAPKPAPPSTADLIQMGFPLLDFCKSSSFPTLCTCHSKLRLKVFICPRCKAQYCEIPVDCGICGLMIVSSPLLARSYKHLVPVLNFKEVNHPTSQEQADSFPSACHACSLPFSALKIISKVASNEGANSNPNTKSGSGLSPTGRYECPNCHNHFCLECELMIHDSLGMCVGCTTGVR
ncbi:TFIIH basal transcription factor complex, subunit SSL1 [Atractiella rhizophila]|nr:TFIIH basal transcription factor complex, subunit SSL1 [Atractiella rhizophila]